MPKETDHTEHAIQRLGHHGDGIAEGPVFAPLTLPGETVTGRIVEQRLQDVRITAPSPDRVTAPCPHFKACGGCSLQHASDDFAAKWKVDVVRNALNSVGLETDIRPIHTSPAHARRRASFASRRSKKGAVAGLHQRHSDVVVQIPNCHLMHPELMGGLGVAEDLARVGASRKAELTVTATVSEHGLDIAVSNGKPLDGHLRQTLAQMCEQAGLARLTWSDEVIAMRAPPIQRLGKAEVVPPPGAFLQATKDGEEALLAAVREIVGDVDRIADLFSGCGTFSLPLAETAAVHAVETEAEMLAALDQGWRKAAGLKPVTTEARDLFRRPLLADELNTYSAVVLDPPRAGAERQTQEIARSNLGLVAFVSCNPVTFARDAKILGDAGFSLEWLQVVDQFRWSAHVELVGAFRR